MESIYKIKEIRSRDLYTISDLLNKEYQNGYELVGIDPPKVTGGGSFVYSHGNSFYIFKKILKKET